MSQRVLVLGAGMIGSAAALDLVRTGFDVTMADARQAALEGVAARAPVTALLADLRDPATVTRLARDADLVLGALPSVLGLQTLRAVIEAGRPCCDISFMPEHAWDLDDLAKQRGVTAVVDCGVAPGVSNLLAGWAAARLQPCRTLEIYVGGLPVVRTWPFEYKAGFAPSDVLEEYTRPARLVERGAIVVREALSEPELMEFPGVGTLEAFNTDGLRSLAYLLDVPCMKEKTLRYPGHIALMRVLRETGLFSKEWIEVPGEQGPQRVRPLDVTSALMFPKWRFGPGEADVTVLRVIATGVEDGREVRHVWDLVDRHDAASDSRSMSRTTGYAATSMVAMLAAGAVPRAGVFPPEVLAREPGFVERFLQEYAARGVQGRAPGRAGRRLVPVLTPESGEVEIHRVEGFGAHRLRARVNGQQHPDPLLEAHDLERLRDGIDQPRVAHALARVDPQLLRAVDHRGRWREHFAHPVGCQGEVGGLRQPWHPLAAPAPDIRHQDVWIQVNLRFVEDGPGTWPSLTEVERTDEDRPEPCLRQRLARRRSGRRVQLVVQNLRDDVLGLRAEVVVGRRMVERDARHDLHSTVVCRGRARPGVTVLSCRLHFAHMLRGRASLRGSRAGRWRSLDERLWREGHCARLRDRAEEHAADRPGDP